MKLNEKLLTRLNPWCPELRGPENSSRAHYPFTVPLRRSSMPEHRGFRMGKLGRIIVFNFSGMNVKIQFFSFRETGEGYNSRAGAATEKALSPILELTLGTTS